jgi:hypothetical protein
MEKNIKTLSNLELNENILNLVKSERKITHQILLYINELELRKLYFTDACNSMFEFLIKKLGYSESAAYRRLSAARLLKQVPEISDKLESGSLNLTQLSQVQTALKQEKKELKIKFGTSHFDLHDKALNVINKLENQNQKQSTVIIAQEFGFSSVSEEKAKMQKDNSLKLELVFDEAEVKLIEKVKALTSHQNPDQSWKELVLLLAKKELKKWEIKSAIKNKKRDSDFSEAEKKYSVAGKFYLEGDKAYSDGSKEVITSVQHEAAPLEKQKLQHEVTPLGKNELQHDHNDSLAAGKAPYKAGKTQRKHLSIKLKRKLFSAANYQCQHVDPQTQVRCSGTHFLQIDHLIPLAKGGEDEFANLRVLCQAHNLKSARDWGIN